MTARDGDAGPNALQNYPLIASAGTFGSQVNVTWSMNSTPNTTFRVEFFASAAADPSGYGQAERYLGFVNVTTDAAGNVASRTDTITGYAGSVAAGEFITATATRYVAGSGTGAAGTDYYETSEFSAAVATVGVTAGLSTTTQGDETGPVAIVYTVTLSQVNNTGSAITFDIASSGGSATSGADYTAIPGGAQISVANGAATGTYTVLVTDDALLEATETVQATISNSSNPAVSIATATATANITDNDAATAALSVTTQGDETGPVAIVYTVTLSQVNNTGSAITFDIASSGGSATSGADYTAIPGARRSRSPTARPPAPTPCW